MTCYLQLVWQFTTTDLSNKVITIMAENTYLEFQFFTSFLEPHLPFFLCNLCSPFGQWHLRTSCGTRYSGSIQQHKVTPFYDPSILLLTQRRSTEYCMVCLCGTSKLVWECNIRNALSSKWDGGIYANSQLCHCHPPKSLLHIADQAHLQPLLQVAHTYRVSVEHNCPDFVGSFPF